MGQSDQVRQHQGGVITCPTFYKSRSANAGWLSTRTAWSIGPTATIRGEHQPSEG
jgi:hypothetical protein